MSPGRSTPTTTRWRPEVTASSTCPARMIQTPRILVQARPEQRPAGAQLDGGEAFGERNDVARCQRRRGAPFDGHGDPGGVEDVASSRTVRVVQRWMSTMRSCRLPGRVRVLGRTGRSSPVPVHRPRTVAFDVVETLISLEPLRDRFVEIGLPAATLDRWFALLLRDGMALTLAGDYQPFPAVAESALRVIGSGR